MFLRKKLPFSTRFVVPSTPSNSTNRVNVRDHVFDLTNRYTLGSFIVMVGRAYNS